MNIEPIPFGRVYPFKSAAAREHCIISETNDTKWYGVFVGERLAGFTAVMYHKEGTWARFKGTYVLPNFRGQGLSVELNEYTLKLALQRGVVCVDAYVTPINAKWYRKRRFIEKAKRNEITYMVLELTDDEKNYAGEPIREEPIVQSALFDVVPQKPIASQDSGMKSYKGWTKEQRLASLKLTKAAIARGEIPPAKKCNRCGQTQGIIQYHNEDYSHPTKYLESLCQRCHLVHHSARRAPEACKRYWDSIKAGKMWPPIVGHPFTALRRDHGIT